MSIENLIHFFKRVIIKLTGANFNVSFSQTGEDLIIKFIFNALKIKNISYLDIGANHYANLNNTYLFYLLGMKGVCVEPDPNLFKKLIKKRSRDTCLNVGVGTKDMKEEKFYIMSNPIFNTFSESEALKIENIGEAKINKSILMKLINVNSLIKDNFSKCPDLISLDIEGIDLEILKEFDFSIYRPKIFCIETITFSTTLRGQKSIEILNLMEKNNYKIFADTYINTIFVDQNLIS